MGLETSVTKVSDLNEAWPLDTDLRKYGDDHLRNIKVALKTLASLPIYANNAAAITGGLVAGKFYRTGADPDVVCVVH